MTPEEIRETLFRTLDHLDTVYRENITIEKLLHKEREAHALEMKKLKAEMERELAEKDAALAEKDSTITEKDNRIAALEHELAVIGSQETHAR